MNKFRKIFDHKMWLYDFAKITGCISSALYLRMKRIYENGKKPKDIFKGKYIVCPNHNSYLDPLKVIRAIPFRRVTFMATKAMFKKKFLSWIFRKFGCIKVEGTNVDSFKKAIDTLNRGHIVTIFPEMYVLPNSDIREYKPGMAMLAALADADILPIYIGTRKKWTRREIAIIGNKIHYKDYVAGVLPTLEEIENITQVVHNKEMELKKIYDDYVEKRYHKSDLRLEAKKQKKLEKQKRKEDKKHETK